MNNLQFIGNLPHNCRSSCSYPWFFYSTTCSKNIKQSISNECSTIICLLMLCSLYRYSGRSLSKFTAASCMTSSFSLTTASFNYKNVIVNNYFVIFNSIFIILWLTEIIKWTTTCWVLKSSPRKQRFFLASVSDAFCEEDIFAHSTYNASPATKWRYKLQLQLPK